jgi:hypothetical protein
MSYLGSDFRLFKVNHGKQWSEEVTDYWYNFLLEEIEDRVFND